MSNVIQFPIDRKVNVIAGEITNLQVQISERFDLLTKLFVQSRQLEKECGELQARYDGLVMEYANAIGPENIPAGVLEYCTQVIAKCEGDTTEISLAFEEAINERTEENPKQGNQLEELAQFMDSVTKFLKGKMDELQ